GPTSGSSLPFRHEIRGHSVSDQAVQLTAPPGGLPLGVLPDRLVFADHELSQLRDRAGEVGAGMAANRVYGKLPHQLAGLGFAQIEPPNERGENLVGVGLLRLEV